MLVEQELSALGSACRGYDVLFRTKEFLSTSLDFADVGRSFSNGVQGASRLLEVQREGWGKRWNTHRPDLSPNNVTQYLVS